MYDDGFGPDSGNRRDRSDRRGGGHGGGRGGGRFDRPFRPTEKHDAVCTECGASCQVPFKPTEGKPVYCRDCFKTKKPRREF